MKSRLTRLDPKSKILKDPAGRKVAHSAGSVSGLARRLLGALALTSELRGGQGGSGPLGVRGAGVGEPQSGRGGGWRMVRERGTGFKKLVR